MKRKNASRNALFTSIISLLLCVSMLVGTTFAWFTDEVVSGTNVITAGNLDVELYHSDKAAPNGEKVTGNTVLFDDVTLWEPGVVAYENFVVKNEGNLALKYQMKLNFDNATDNGNGGTLVDVLKVAIVEGGFAPTNDRVEAQKLAYNHNLSSFVLEGELEANEASKEYGLVIYWEPSDNDNDYNLNNREKDEFGAALKPLTIDLGIHLFATQLDYESDSFGPDYDYNENVLATVKTTEELREAINAATEAGTIYLEAGTYEVNNVLVISGKQLNIVANGDVKFVKTGGSHIFNVADGSKVVFDGITMDGAGLNREGIYVRNNCDVTLRNVKISNTGGKDIMIDEASDAAHGLNTTSTVNLENSSVEDVAACASPVTSVAAEQDTYVRFNFDANSSVGSFEKQSINEKPENIYVNGDNGVKVASDAAAIKAAVEGAKDGETVYIGAGTYDLTDQIQIDNKSISIVGIGNVTLKTSGGHGFQLRNAWVNLSKDPTAAKDMVVDIKNVTINGAQKSGIMVRNDIDLNLEDVTFTGSFGWAPLQVENAYDDECIDYTAKINAKGVVADKVTMEAAAGHTTYFTYENCQFGMIETKGEGKVIINGAETAPGNINIINSAEELYALSGTQISGTYALDADIDMTGYEMKPIMLSSGSDNKLTFLGNDHTISNLTLVKDTQNGMSVSGLFNILHSGAELNVSDLTLTNVNSTSDKYAAAVVAYNSTTLTINLDNVDVNGATVSAETVAALVGYTTGAVNMTDCDVSGLSLTGEKDEKIGALVGTANQPSCVVTTTDCTNSTSYRDYGRVINGAIWNGTIPVSTTEGLIAAVKNAPVGKSTQIILADGTYNGNIDITVAALGKSGGDVVIKAAEGAKPVITGTVTLGYREQTVGATMYNANVSFEGITFDHAEPAKHSLDVQDVKSLTLTNCKIIGDGEYGIGSARGNGTGASKIVGCTFENAGMQLLGNFATGLVIDDCTFNDSCINVQAGNSVTVQNCKFNNTLTDANVDDSFYLIRSNSTPITVKNCQASIDSTVTGVATSQAKWYLLANRGTTNWTVEDVAITITDAALAQTELKVTACTSTGAINTTNVTVNGAAYTG